MGRPSKLTPAQWTEVQRRLLGGETPRALGAHFGIAESAIRKRFGAHKSVSAQSAQVRAAAEKLVEANIALEALPVSQRPAAMDLAELLRSTSMSLGRAADLGARTAHRLQALANSEVAKVDDADPMASVEKLKGVSALTRLANDSASIALNLLAANKDRMKPDEPPGGVPASVLVVPGLMADSASWSQAAQAATKGSE